MARASSSLASATLIKLVYEQPLRCDALSRRQLGKTSKWPSGGMVDTPDSKSGARKSVGVRVPPWLHMRIWWNGRHATLRT